MGRKGGMVDVDPASWLAAVRDATIAAGSARVSWVQFVDPLPPEASQPVSMRQDGVTNLQQRRTSVVTDYPEGGPWDRLATQVAERWPWLEEGDETADGENRSLYLGSAQYFLDDVRCVQIADGPESGPRSHADPTWVVDALAGALADARFITTESLGSTETERYAAMLDLRRAKTVLGDGFAGSLGGRDTRQHLQAEIWIDADRRARRITSSPTTYTCRRPGLLLRDPPSCQSAGRLWTTVDLWDYGLPVTIPTPEVSGGSAWRGLYELWRRRREWNHEQRGG
jgi:hypothetical protein